MRGNTSPTSCPHRRCRQSQQIESLAFTDLSRRSEHYRRHHCFIATSYDLPSPHRQRRLPLPPPSEDNDDDDDDDADNADDDADDDDADADANANADKEEDNDDEENDDKENKEEDSEDEDEEDSDDEDSDDDDDEDSDNLSHDDVASNLECLCTQLSIVQHLIVALGPQFQISYSPVSRPDYCEVTTLSDCLYRQVVFVVFALLMFHRLKH
jgi:hypothetical protein